MGQQQNRVRLISANILTVLCTRPGEVPLHPTLGVAPDLFQPLSGKEPQYFRFKMREAILTWVAGIDYLDIDFIEWRDYENHLKVDVMFVPQVVASQHHLTFGWYSYLGPDWSDSDRLMQDIYLDGRPFTALR